MCLPIDDAVANNEYLPSLIIALLIQLLWSTEVNL